MYLAFDTETTDLPRPHLDLAHPSQPHLLQFAGVVFDEQGEEVERLSTLVRPGLAAAMSPKAFEAHGISVERAFHCGMEASDVFRWFTTRAANAERIIGHNVEFDVQIMSIVSARLTGEAWAPSCAPFCTMAHSMPIVNLPPTARMIAAGRYHPKPPTLSECIAHFFGERLTGAHDAAADVAACIRIFRHLTLERATA